MKLFSEQDVLDLAFRVKVIKEIESNENKARKAECLKRYEIYKDRVKKYVIDGLRAEGLKEETIQQMANRCANVSICRKVVNKLARTYSGGVTRDAGTEAINIQINDLGRLLCFDEKMRKGDRYRELQKNMMFQIVPEGVLDPALAPKMLYKLSMRTLLPWHYDVIEDYRDREIARCVVLSDYYEGDTAGYYATENEAGFHYSKPTLVTSNDRDDIIADNPRDANKGCEKRYVFWTERYHFSCDEKGNIIANEENPNNENPVMMLPFVNNAEDQDGQFWAVGGDDLINGSVLINKEITDMLFIAYLQGFGQWVVTGRNLKDRIVLGPNNAIVLDYDEESGDPKPEVTVVSANPPLESWLRIIEQHVALLLTTNNLSTANVAMKLDSSTFPSGIAALIEMSEATDDVSDKQKSYKDIERTLWELVKRWQNALLATGELAEEYAEVGALPEELDISIKFNDIKPVVTEKEKLETLKQRKELGLNTDIELIMLDNPDLTEEEAQEKLDKITEQKDSEMKKMQENMPDPALAPPGKKPPPFGKAKDDAYNEE